VCTSEDVTYLVYIVAVNAGQSSDFISYDSSAKSVSWQSSQSADAGTFEIKVVSILKSESITKSVFLTTTADSTTFTEPDAFLTNKNSPMLEYGAQYNQTSLDLLSFTSNFINIGKPIDLDDEEISLSFVTEPTSGAFVYDSETGFLVFSLA